MSQWYVKTCCRFRGTTDNGTGVVKWPHLPTEKDHSHKPLLIYHLQRS